MSDLTRFINRVERLEEEIRALQADRTAVYAEAKAAGFDPKIMRKVVAERRMKTQDRLEQEAMLDTYRHELGMLADMPLGAAALKAAKNDGRAAPRAAGNYAGGPPSAQQSVPTRPADPASPDPTPLEEAVARTLVDVEGPKHCVDCAAEVEPTAAMIHEGVKPLCRRCFGLRAGDETRHPALTCAVREGQPPDIPRFLDRREKAGSAA